MRRIVNLCFVALAVCAVVYGLLLKYNKPTNFGGEMSKSETKVTETSSASTRISPIEDLSIPQD
jgi:peptidoglycan/LPS O-acetylase OafA/YrhL